jgi:ABC-type multidrug transport system permease subunit
MPYLQRKNKRVFKKKNELKNMDWKTFFKPTEGKILSLIIIAIVVVVSKFLSGFVGQLIYPQWLLEELASKPMSEVMMEHLSEVMIFGLELIFINAIIFLILIYIAICIIFRFFNSQNVMKK